MPQTRCKHCQTVGFVRREHVIQGRHATLLYYCGACDHSWAVEEAAPKTAATNGKSDAPDR